YRNGLLLAKAAADNLHAHWHPVYKFQIILLVIEFVGRAPRVMVFPGLIWFVKAFVDDNGRHSKRRIVEKIPLRSVCTTLLALYPRFRGHVHPWQHWCNKRVNATFDPASQIFQLITPY